MKNLSTVQVINIALILLVIVFIGQNLASIKVHFLFFEFNLPLIVIICVCLLIGYISGILFGKRKESSAEEV